MLFDCRVCYLVSFGRQVLFSPFGNFELLQVFLWVFTIFNTGAITLEPPESAYSLVRARVSMMNGDLEPVTSINRVINGTTHATSNGTAAPVSHAPAPTPTGAGTTTVHGDETHSKATKRRPRRSYNCGPCKRQKIKCDTNIPCGACTRHNRIDQCLASPPNPPSPDHKKRVRKQSLSSFGQLPNDLPLPYVPKATPFTTPRTSATTLTTPPVPEHSQMRLPSLQAHTSSFQLDSVPQRINYPKPWDQPVFSLSHSSSNRDEEVTELKSQVALLTDRLVTLESKLSSTVTSSRADHSTTIQDVIQIFPEMNVLHNLVEFFKVYLNKPLEIVDNKLVDTRFQSFRGLSSTSVPDANDWETVALVAIIAALTVLHYPIQNVQNELHMTMDNVISYSNSLLKVSKTALNNVKYKESPKLIHIQILLLSDISLKLFNKKNLMMAMDSELVSMSYVLGLQSAKVPQNALEWEVPQKIWWLICHNDIKNSLRFSIPNLIRLDRLASDPVGNSHILKAFISAEKTDHESIMTHIAKLTIICNDIPTSVGSSLAEYLENLIMVDRQLTGYRIPPSFNLSNPRNDIIRNMQSIYLHFFLLMVRFRVYHKIYFSNPNNGIWFIMLSIMESFLKMYNELRKLYPPREFLNHYIQIAEYPIICTIINLIIMCTSPDLLPQGLKDVMMNYLATMMEDLELLRSTVFNEKIPFYSKALSTIQRLAQYMRQAPSMAVNKTHRTTQSDLTQELKESKVFESLESSAGLVPSNDFFNIYFRTISHHSRTNTRTTSVQSWKLSEILAEDEINFLSCLGL